MSVIKAASFAVTALLLTSGAKAATVDFDSLPIGTIVTSQFVGVTFSLLGGAPIAGPRTYALQDTSGNPQFIFGASGNAITPGDNVGGINPPFYDFQINFAAPVDYFSLLALDAEESVSASAFLGNNFVDSVNQGVFLGLHSASVFNGPVYKFELGAIGGFAHFDRVVIDLSANDGPEVYDNLVFNVVTPIPEPNDTMLFVSGLALLLGFSQRQRTLGRSLPNIRAQARLTAMKGEKAS
jgi:hypothetical protein